MHTALTIKNNHILLVKVEHKMPSELFSSETYSSSNVNRSCFVVDLKSGQSDLNMVAVHSQFSSFVSFGAKFVSLP